MLFKVTILFCYSSSEFYVRFYKSSKKYTNVFRKLIIVSRQKRKSILETIFWFYGRFLVVCRVTKRLRGTSWHCSLHLTNFEVSLNATPWTLRLQDTDMDIILRVRVSNDCCTCIFIYILWKKKNIYSY